MSWPTIEIRRLAPPRTASIGFASDQSVWQLSLDQIESETGEVGKKRYGPARDAGSSTFEFDERNVLYSKLRPYLNKVVLPDESGIATTELIPLRPDPNSIDRRYLAYYLRSKQFVNQASHHVAGAKMPRVVMDWFWAHKIPLPTLSEQLRIVELLDEADHLRKLRREVDKKASRILPSLFLKTFGDPATNSMSWPMATIGSILKAADYGTSTKASDDGYGLPLIRMGNVDYDGNLRLDDLKRVMLSESDVCKYRLEAGDILFNRTNSKELVGKTGLWDERMDAVLASYFIRLRVDREQVTPTFLWAFMNSRHMKRVLLATARGAIGQANINATELRALPMYRPPVHIQRLFDERVRAIRAAFCRNDLQDNLDDLFELMLRRAFSGQLTAKWRSAHMQELLVEIKEQARLLNLPMTKELEANS